MRVYKKRLPGLLKSWGDCICSSVLLALPHLGVQPDTLHLSITSLFNFLLVDTFFSLPLLFHL